ncbi:hypothetical protein RND71_042740 [Anisodus tanguticus]|uniref:SHSP domain-containing protein n=1 Tax=Anisodus tanguticus TaxID=243964 RepID=A0AAE1QSX3_9SOLA|nr:hypothetical protein RND71_042740 [Anisodus tanguticus]
MENPFQISGPRGAYEAKNMEEGMYVRMEMPGIDKEDVKVSINYGNISIQGEGKESKHEDTGRTYSANIEICSNSYQPQFMEAEMKNGILRMLIPKSKTPQGVNGSYKIKRQDLYQLLVNLILKQGQLTNIWDENVMN